MSNYLNIGEVSGCLEVIGEFLESENELQETFCQWAEEEWEYYVSHTDSNIDFRTHYELTKQEKKLFLNREKMPESFVGKYRKKGSCYKISYDNRFLWHKSKPNTRDLLNEAYRKGRLYKVKCTKCGRVFYTDAYTLNCVEWKNCIGGECLATTASKVVLDYTKSLYDWDMVGNELRVVDNRLAQVESSIDNTLTYYGAGKKDGVRIAYISDIHLHHHLKYYQNNEEQMLDDVVEKLHHSLEQLDEWKLNRIYAIFFGGDISEAPELTIKFLKKFRAKVNQPIFFVLGNHEYIEFENVQDCVDFYRKELRKLKITLLHNEYVVCNRSKERFIIFGGTGFGKYDEKWNADTIVCCPNFSRDDEFKETTLFETNYQIALNVAKREKLCMFCLSHYPISACLNNAYEKEVVYFSGHNHNNEYVRKEDKVLYADNQVGYKNNNIAFKEANSGLTINPYDGMKDGLYCTSVEDYLKFYRYLGEYVGDGTLLYNRCKNGNLYVVKRKGYYGFFIISTKKGSKGISIVNGGVTKKLTASTEISWICENFDIVVSKYLQMLLPLRKVQEKISKELKELGLDGTIHGLIVDIDFFHHIALDPIEGKAEFYFSSVFGSKMELPSFEEVIASLELRDWSSQRDYSLLRSQYEEKKCDYGYLLGAVSGANLLEVENNETKVLEQRTEHLVSRSEGMYKVSRKISPLQRLFTGHVLRDFDLRLTETQQQIAHRKKLYLGKQFKYEGVKYQIVEDNGGDIVIAEEVKKGLRVKGSAVQLSGKRKRFVFDDLKSKIKQDGERKTHWID